MEDIVAGFEEWVIGVRHLSTGTLTAYSHVVTNYVNHVGVHRVLSGSVTGDEVDAFLNRPRRPGGSRTRTVEPAAATRQRDRIALNTFYKWLGSRIAVRSPMMNVGVPKVDNIDPNPVSDDTWMKVWDVDMERADRAWLGLAFVSGLRRSEIASVSPSQFDCSRGQVRIVGKGQKGRIVEYREMAHIISDEMPWLGANLWLPELDWLIDRRGGERVLIPWDTPATEQARFRASITQEWVPDSKVLWRRLSSISRRAGVSTDDCAPHRLRASAATNLFRAGVPELLVATLLGHASLDTTRRYIATSGQLGAWRRQRSGGGKEVL